MAAQKKIEIIATENVSEKINKAKEALNNITNSTMPAKKQMRELQKLMMDMNLDGLSNTDAFTQVAQRAGELKDAMSDAQQAMNAYANDTFQLKAAAEGFQAITAAGTIATGVMGLFGTENEKVQQIMLKVQAAQGILNGVTAIANVLNKDSALMLKIKQMRLAANMATQKSLTTATVAGTAAEAASNITTKKGTIIQNAWNVAKAVSKALVGDFTGLLLVGAVAVGAYAMATSNSTDELKEQNNQLKLNKEQFDTLKNATDSYVSNTSSSFAQLMKNYDDLRDTWNKLKTSHEKNQFLKDNKAKIEELTTAVNGIDTAESFFNDKTGNVVKAFKLRAQAAAAAAVQIEMYKKAMEAEMNMKFGMRGTVINETNFNRLPKNIQDQLQVNKTERRVVGTKYNPSPDGGYRSNEYAEVPIEWKIPQDASEELLEALRKQGFVAKSARNAYNAAMEMANWADNKSDDLEKKARALLADGKKTTGNGSGNGNNKPDKSNDTYEKDKLNLQNEFNKGVLTELEYKDKLLSLERSHFEALLKTGKATKEDAQRYMNLKAECDQLKIQTQYTKELNDAQLQFNQGVLTEQQYLEKLHLSINQYMRRIAHFAGYF